MKVGFVSSDWSDIEDEVGVPTMGGAGWYRCGLPAKFLALNDVETVVVELISLSADGIWLHDWHGVTHDDCDVIVFQRWMGRDAPKVIRAAKAAGQVIVNDVDDWYWGLHPLNRAYKMTDPKLYPECNRDHYWEALKESSLITVSSQDLADKLANIGVPVGLVRNAIDVDRWEQFPVLDSSPLRVGWVGSTSHRSGDLETLRGVLGPFCERRGATFVHCGWNEWGAHAGDLAGVPLEQQFTHGMLPITEYPQMFQHMDIGLVPLNKVPFNESKSAIKGMEYSCAGIPWIGQDCAEYKFVNKEYDLGQIARKPSDWVRLLERMVDVEFRQSEAERNRKNVRQLDIADRWVEWADIYKSIVS